MAEGDADLREEMEKVRERTRLLGISQGLSPGEAESRAADAVGEFCARWGIPQPPRQAAPLASAVPFKIRHGPIHARSAPPPSPPSPAPSPPPPPPAAGDAVPDPAHLAKYTDKDLQLIARDLTGLRGGLQSMLALCDELESRLGALLPKDGSGPGGGGDR